jgi:hypothetical protein
MHERQECESCNAVTGGMINGQFRRRAQLIDATHSANFAAGI